MDVDTSWVSMKDTKEDVKCLRKLPFSASERELIVALVRDRPIIEDKRTHANNILLKKQAWEALAVAFNAQPYVSLRTSVQLKRCWENIKSQRKKELSQESRSMIVTGGGPPQGGSAASSNNVIDIICPSINLTVPGVIDSNSIEISQDLCFSPTSPDNDLKEIIERKKPERARKIPYEQDNEVENTSPFQLKRKFNKEFVNTPTSVKKLESEMDARKKRCTINIQNDQALHELRIQREKILIKRETNLMEYEKEIHELQKKKLKLEIDLLGRINKN